MKNPQPRFSYDEENDWIFDYATSKSHPCEGILYVPDGSWDLAKVKELILAGKPIETAYLGAADKIEQSNAGFLAGDGVELNSAVHPGYPENWEPKLDENGQPTVDESLPEITLSEDSLEKIEIDLPEEPKGE